MGDDQRSSRGNRDFPPGGFNKATREGSGGANSFMRQGQKDRQNNSNSLADVVGKPGPQRRDADVLGKPGAAGGGGRGFSRPGQGGISSQEDSSDSSRSVSSRESKESSDTLVNNKSSVSPPASVIDSAPVSHYILIIHVKF